MPGGDRAVQPGSAKLLRRLKLSPADSAALGWALLVHVTHTHRSSSPRQMEAAVGTEGTSRNMHPNSLERVLLRQHPQRELLPYEVSTTTQRSNPGPELFPLPKQLLTPTQLTEPPHHFPQTPYTLDTSALQAPPWHIARAQAITVHCRASHRATQPQARRRAWVLEILSRRGKREAPPLSSLQ